ncbi:MAG: hypothetical protein C0468_05895 [Planctomyces sp.]|nr:hypothetical protein [Planctomyces sp.]
MRLGREAVVTLTDGRRFTGILVRDDGREVVLRIAGIETLWPAARVDLVRLLPSVDDRYRQAREGLDPDSYPLHSELALWLVSVERVDLAIEVMEAYSQRHADHEQARRDLHSFRLLAELRAKQARPGPTAPPPVQPTAQPTAQPPAPRPPAGGDARPTAPARTPLLDAREQALVKAFELALDDSAEVTIPDDVLDDLFKTYGSTPRVPATPEARALFRSAPARVQLETIFSLRARELYPRLIILGLPDSLRRFRDDVHAAYLVSACATAACHGGQEAGRLAFATGRPPNSDANVLTNFVIADRFVALADGQPQPLLDWASPERSLLLQYALPRDEAQLDHPPAPGPDGRDRWRQALSGRQDPRYAAALQWVRSVVQPRPEFDLRYKPARPFEPPTAPPANATASPPR